MKLTKKDNPIEDRPVLRDHIKEYLADTSNNKNDITAKALFTAERQDVDIKSELSDEEIVLVNTLKFNDLILKSAGLNQQYEEFINGFLRLKISRERRSRGEFVEMNRGLNPKDDVLDTMSKISNITQVKK